MTQPKLSQGEFDLFNQLVYQLTGIAMGPAKRSLLETRIGKRLRLSGVDNFGAYRKFIMSEQGEEELAHMIDAVSTNKTAFFRESEHFRFLGEKVLPDLAPGPLRFWSAACSSGEEAYTLAMMIRRHLPHWQQRGVKILATDISNRMLDKAEDGIYKGCEQAIPAEQLRACFQKQSSREGDRYRIRPELRALVQFRYLNLMGEFPFRSKFQVIFCRNVMIYFDTPTRARLIARLTHCLAPGGYLFVGHSESLGGISPSQLQYVRPAVYRCGGGS